MPVVVRYVFAKCSNEHLFRPQKFHHTLCSSVLCQELHFSLRNLQNVIERNRRSSNVPACVAQELCLRHERADVDDPFSFVLLFYNSPELLSSRVKPQRSCPQCHPKVGEESETPHLHQFAFIKVQRKPDVF